MYDRLKKIIEENREIIDFSKYGEGVSNKEIEIAEKRLNIKMPASYIWWLKNYNGGCVFDDEIYSIYGEVDGIPCGDIVYVNELYRKENFELYKDKLILLETGKELFYFDLNSKNTNNEYDILGWYSKKVYAQSFEDFLIKYITDTL